MITTATRRPLRQNDVSRMIGRILGKDKRHPGRGWDVLGARYCDNVIITLNFFDTPADRAAWEQISTALGARYTLTYTEVLGDYEFLPEEYDGCAVVEITRREEPTIPATPAQETPAMPTAPTPEDTVTLRVPGRVANFFQERTPHLTSSLDALERDIATALERATTARHGKNGTVTTMTAPAAVTAGFLATLASLADAEFGADHADTQGATAALAYVHRCEIQGITTTAPADYRMSDPAAQAALDADRAAQQAQQERDSAQRAEAAQHRDAWNALTPADRAERTSGILDAACAVFGLQRTDTRTWLTIGSLTARVTDGRLYMEITRLSAPAAQAALDAAREALQAAGWTVTDYGTHFYAQHPQAGPQGVPATPAPADTDDNQARPVPVEIVWTHREGDRLTGMIQLGPLHPADAAAVEATGKEDQAHITGGRRRATLDAFSDYNPADGWTLTRVTPEAAARHLVDWLGFTGRPLTLTTIDETRY